MTHLLLHRRTLLTAVASAAMPRTAAAQAPDLPFIVLGDWGRGGAYEQRAVGVTMGRAASGSRFTLNVGDNFYGDGVSGIDDPQWADSFEHIYDDPALSTPWHSILGNHDYRGNIDAQLRYRGSVRWHMPAPYYARTEALPDGTRVDFSTSTRRRSCCPTAAARSGSRAKTLRPSYGGCSMRSQHRARRGGSWSGTTRFTRPPAASMTRRS